MPIAVRVIAIVEVVFIGQGKSFITNSRSSIRMLLAKLISTKAATVIVIMIAIIVEVDFVKQSFYYSPNFPSNTY